MCCLCVQKEKSKNVVRISICEVDGSVYPASFIHFLFSILRAYPSLSTKDIYLAILAIMPDSDRLSLSASVGDISSFVCCMHL